MLECTVALAVLATAATVAAQLGTWALTEKGRAECRLFATEAAANILEEGRAADWADLTTEWAGSRRLPKHVADRLHDAALTVKVEPEPDRKGVKRVTVDIQWEHRDTAPPRQVSLVGLFADRSTGGQS
jgi:hypothetical protein